MQLRIVSFASLASFVTLAAVVVGCSNGSSDPPAESPTSSTQPLTTADATAADAATMEQVHAKMVKHAQCMRAHGATDWPDPPPPNGDGGRRMILATTRHIDGAAVQAIPARPIDGEEVMPRIPDDAGPGPRLFIARRAGDDGGAVDAALKACASELPGELVLHTIRE
ncbi:hypothetical protein LZC95_29295 [Pendulispora brunnea]|uniref:Uncharacterized protein n=1 Tax=Pendulispora brunnea TaxID=2905690 RepID=A0ABZ2JVQ2_9BACT